ncbi:MAG: FAD:protein FMN transferase [Candidatus Dormibacter sp.]
MGASIDFRALGTGVRVVTVDPAGLDPAVRAVQDLLAQVDQACSRFRPDSELSQLNRSAGRPVRVSPLLFLALTTALRVSRMTAGAVDPTVGTAMRIIGYDRDFADLPPDGAFTVAARPVPGYERIRLVTSRQEVTCQSDVEIDLGSSAKALAADLAARAAFAAAGSGVLVSLGGDIAVAGTAPADGWPVLIADDHAAPLDGPGEVVSISAGGLATSSTMVRHWRQAGVERHHIVDPRTGAPAQVHWRTVSVAAASCVDANAAATAAIVWGDAALDWLERHHLAARLVKANGGVTRLSGWPRAAVAV